MIVRIFKSSQPVAMLSIPLVGLILRLGIFFNGSTDIENVNNFMPFFQWLMPFNTDFPIISGLISWAIVSIQALYFNYIIEDQIILPRKNYLFGFIYITLACYLPQFHYLNPAILSGCLLLPALHKILLLSKQNSSYNHAFDSAILTGCAALIYLPSLVFYIVIFIGLIYFKPIKVRIWILSLVGLLLPFVFLSTYLYWHESTETFWNLVDRLNFGSNQSSSYNDLKLLIPLIPILILSIPKYFNDTRGNTVRVKNIYLLFIWLIIIAILIPFIFLFNGLNFIFLLLLGSVLFIANYFYFENRNWLVDVNYLFLFVSVVYINYLR